MISLIYPLFSGDAIRIELDSPANAQKCRIIRNTTGTFTNENDSGKVYEGEYSEFVDWLKLTNGVTYFYKVFYFDGTSWIDGGAPQNAMPALNFQDISDDPQGAVRTRLDSGLNALIAAGRFHHPHGKINVLTASPAIEDSEFPLVTVLLTSDSSNDRFLGGQLGEENSSGYLSSVALEVVTWCLNGDSRRDLRKAVKAVLIANQDFLTAIGVVSSKLNFSDSDDFTTYQCPIYLSNLALRFTCQSAVKDTTHYPLLDTVNVTVNP